MHHKPTAYRLLLLLLILLVVFVLDLVHGPVKIPFKEVWRILSGKPSQDTWEFILLNFRMPKAIAAILVGAGLSVAGLMMQTLFRNPLAGPFVLGISSGASLGVALLVMASVWLGHEVTSIAAATGYWPLVLASVAGSLAVMLLVIMVSLRVTDSVSILIIGIMFGSITGAVVSVLQYFSDPDTVHSFLVWTFGSISGVTWSQLAWLAPAVVAGLLISYTLQKPLNALLLGENHARTIGVAVKRTRFWVIVLTSLMAGSITAFAGPIAFVGVAVPHLARAWVRSSDHRLVTPVAMMSGAILLLACDLISQLPGSGQILPINSVTAIFGAPVVIWVIIRSRRGRYFFNAS